MEFVIFGGKESLTGVKMLLGKERISLINKIRTKKYWILKFNCVASDINLGSYSFTMQTWCFASEFKSKFLFLDLGSSFWGMALVLASTKLLTARIAAGCLALALFVVLFVAKNVSKILLWLIKNF